MLTPAALAVMIGHGSGMIVGGFCDEAVLGAADA